MIGNMITKCFEKMQFTEIINRQFNSSNNSSYKYDSIILIEHFLFIRIENYHVELLDPIPKKSNKMLMLTKQFLTTTTKSVINILSIDLKLLRIDKSHGSILLNQFYQFHDHELAFELSKHLSVLLSQMILHRL